MIPTTIADHVTIGDKYDPVWMVQTPEEAAAYFRLCVEHTQRIHNMPADEAARMEAANIRYFTGYGTYQEANRVRTLFGSALTPDTTT